MEYSLQHQLPNFAECWWDHWILDVLLTNWLGIYIGMKICEYFQMKAYSFRGISDIPSYKGKLKRGMQQFSPVSWTKFEWGMTKSFTRFAAIVAIITLEIICELNAFYLKYLLWIPISSRLNLWRLLYFFFICLPGIRESYQYISDPDCKRLGTFAWIAMANIITETIIVLKFSPGEFTTPFPGIVKVAWVGIAFTLIGYSTWKFALPEKAKTD